MVHVQSENKYIIHMYNSGLLKAVDTIGNYSKQILAENLTCIFGLR